MRSTLLHLDPALGVEIDARDVTELRPPIRAQGVGRILAQPLPQIILGRRILEVLKVAPGPNALPPAGFDVSVRAIQVEPLPGANRPARRTYGHAMAC